MSSDFAVPPYRAYDQVAGLVVGAVVCAGLITVASLALGQVGLCEQIPHIAGWCLVGVSAGGVVAIAVFSVRRHQQQCPSLENFVRTYRDKEGNWYAEIEDKAFENMTTDFVVAWKKCRGKEWERCLGTNRGYIGDLCGWGELHYKEESLQGLWSKRTYIVYDTATFKGMEALQKKAQELISDDVQITRIYSEWTDSGYDREFTLFAQTEVVKEGDVEEGPLLVYGGKDGEEHWEIYKPYVITPAELRDSQEEFEFP